MYFNFIKKFQILPKLQGLKLEVGKFVSVTVSKAGLVQSDFSHIKLPLVNHNRIPTDRGGSIVSITVIIVVLTLQITFL